MLNNKDQIIILGITIFIVWIVTLFSSFWVNLTITNSITKYRQEVNQLKERVIILESKIEKLSKNKLNE
jgi:cell division protein FtsB